MKQKLYIRLYGSIIGSDYYEKGGNMKEKIIKWIGISISILLSIGDFIALIVGELDIIPAHVDEWLMGTFTVALGVTITTLKKVLALITKKGAK